MFASALRRHAGDGAFNQLEQRLLHAFAGHVTGNRRVLGLARDLVNFVDVNDAALGFFDVVITLLQQPRDDVFNIFTDVTGFGERRGVSNCKRHIQQPRKRFGQQGFARTGGANQQHVGLGDFNTISRTLGRQAFEVVVDRH